MEKHIDTINEQTKTKPQEIQLNEWMDSFSFNPSINFQFYEEEKWLLAVTIFQEATSVINIVDENNGFSVTTPEHWTPKIDEETHDKLFKLLEFRSENDIELHVKEVEKRSLMMVNGFFYLTLKLLKKK